MSICMIAMDCNVCVGGTVWERATQFTRTGTLVSMSVSTSVLSEGQLSPSEERVERGVRNWVLQFVKMETMLRRMAVCMDWRRYRLVDGSNPSSAICGPWSRDTQPVSISDLSSVSHKWIRFIVCEKERRIALTFGGAECLNG